MTAGSTASTASPDKPIDSRLFIAGGAALARMPQQPIGHGAPAPTPVTDPAKSLSGKDLGGDTPTVRAERSRLRAARGYNLQALLKQKDTVNPVQCPNCGQLARLSANGDRTRARCADCGNEWALGAAQPPTFVRSHVRANAPAPEPTPPAGATNAHPS